METIIAAVISGIFNLIVGFYAGNKYANNNSQNQKARDNANQIQIGRDNNVR